LEILGFSFPVSFWFCCGRVLFLYQCDLIWDAANAHKERLKRGIENFDLNDQPEGRKEGAVK
jgi:hypothetical protein